MRIGPRALAMCAFLTCGHYLPVGRATALLETMTGLHLATGFTARARRRAAKKLLATFLPHMKDLLATAPVLHADETTGRAAGALAYVHVACTEYLTLMHVGGRSSKDIDNGGVLTDFTGILVRDGYAGYEHLPALHAWCGSHYAEAGVMRKRLCWGCGCACAGGLRSRLCVDWFCITTGWSGRSGAGPGVGIGPARCWVALCVRGRVP